MSIRKLDEQPVPSNITPFVVGDMINVVIGGIDGLILYGDTVEVVKVGNKWAYYDGIEILGKVLKTPMFLQENFYMPCGIHPEDAGMMGT